MAPDLPRPHGLVRSDVEERVVVCGPRRAVVDTLDDVAVVLAAVQVAEPQGVRLRPVEVGGVGESALIGAYVEHADGEVAAGTRQQVLVQQDLLPGQVRPGWRPGVGGDVLGRGATDRGRGGGTGSGYCCPSTVRDQYHQWPCRNGGPASVSATRLLISSNNFCLRGRVGRQDRVGVVVFRPEVGEYRRVGAIGQPVPVVDAHVAVRLESMRPSGGGRWVGEAGAAGCGTARQWHAVGIRSGACGWSMT